MTSNVKEPMPSLSGFADLPDIARVRLPIVAALFSVAPRTVLRHVNTGDIPQPVKQCGVLSWRVGDLRRALDRHCR